MGTNFYLARKQPTIREAIHICKRSWGWKTSWQATEPQDWPRWCDEQPMYEPKIPHPIHDVEDVRAYLRTGEWELMDEYGDVHDDWEAVIDLLVARGGRDHVNECGGGYHTRDGDVFCREGFC